MLTRHSHLVGLPQRQGMTMIELPEALKNPRELYARVESEPFPESITALLQGVVKRYPDRPAIQFIDGSPTLSYAELDRAAGRLAGGLKQLGVVVGTRVAVLMPNKPAYPITYLAAARLGATIVPLNVALTPRELAYALNDAGATYVIVDGPLLAGLREALPDMPNLADDRLIVVGAGDPALVSWESLAEAEPFEGDDGHFSTLLTVQYTSGTTGLPKGAMQTQEFWMCIGMAQSAELKHLDVQKILVVHSFYYMDALWELMMAFCLNGTIVLAPRMSASNYMAWVREYDIHYALVTPHIFKQPESPLDGRHNLRLLQTYGFSKELHAAFEERFNVRVRETFGMTEIGAGAFVPVIADDKTGSGAVGISAPYRRLKIVDDNGEEVPDGEIGELWATGRGLFLGYNNMPEATDAIFRDGWVRTGDLFRRDPDGFYYIVGRMKDMVRRNMENISAREVEDILIGHPAVANAAVMGVPDPAKTEEVLALVVLRDGHQVSPQDLNAYCQGRLAKFKWPRYFGFHDSFPLTPSAKVAKHEIKKGTPDLLANVFDVQEDAWITPGGGLSKRAPVSV
jgi:crotonobetaine/carnitine-CoA ligase